MIIWINGAFGSGKTQTANELHRRIPNSFLFDPENAGYYIRKNVPKQIAAPDFQDYPMWREMNYAMLRHIDRTYDGIVIAPMTVVNPLYFEEMVGRLREDGVVVNHFALCASREVLLKRLRGRGDGKNSWPAQQIDRCIEGLSDARFRQHLDTEHTSIEENAETIASALHIRLLPDDRSKLKKRFDRIAVQIKQIRFFS
ncbi:AAA family ATPase [Paenibacillus thermotolerans]|uniref:AAA family ATPase n=1 Tax=Paenibacillus thermotolerans TaxID=3027807 RepID=UPI002367FFBD|nr:MULTISPECIES: AAA family ATPase [unclassified Paenibacillus]